MLAWLLNKLGYYRIDQLEVGGCCGLCGKAMPNDIFIKDWKWGVCIECSYRLESKIEEVEEEYAKSVNSNK